LCRPFDTCRDSKALVEGVSDPSNQIPSNAVELAANF
jgi:hypothetical protein